MAWETRGGSRRYYYAAEKIGGRVRKRYLGSSATAAYVAYLEARDRERAEDQRRADGETLALLDRVDAVVTAFCGQVEQQTTATLTAAGYHRQNRGVWRKKRGGATDGD